MSLINIYLLKTHLNRICWHLCRYQSAQFWNSLQLHHHVNKILSMHGNFKHSFRNMGNIHPSFTSIASSLLSIALNQVRLKIGASNTISTAFSPQNVHTVEKFVLVSYVLLMNVLWLVIIYSCVWLRVYWSWLQCTYRSVVLMLLFSSFEISSCVNMML